LKGWFFNLLYIFSLAFLVKEWDLSRLVVLLSGGFSLLTLASAQYGILAWERYLWKKGKLTVRVLIVGAGEIGLRTLQKLKDDPEQKYEVVGFLDDDPSKEGKWIGKSPVLGKLSDLKKVVESYRVDEVIFAIPHLDPEKILSTLLTLDPHRVPVRVVADLFGVLHQETQVDLIEEIPIYELKGADDSLPYRIGKRVMDLIGGLILFAIFLLTFPIIALAIKLDSPGPIFFVQDRVGEKGRRFKMYKYRTMYVDTPPYAYAPHDPEDRRITSVGRFLRRTSLDELPQVINLLKGDMSLVGPRPEMPFIVEKYTDWQRKRLEVKPGITGLWQILGRKELPLHENLEYDFYYIKNRSLLLDLVILIKTIPALLKRKGAY
jgi:exopolysaccharide biosynthesis polyprenyl glycosylphosphotransferase